MSFGPSWRGLLQRNPIFARELRQAARTGRTIVLLLVLAVLVGLFVLGVAGVFGMGRAPINLGPVLFQVFFSLAFFIVCTVGPSLAAVSVASEKDGRTWDALVLTGMDRSAIARGKFWTAATAVGAFLVMIAPGSLLCLVLGGVTIAELLVAFVLLAIIAVIGIAFGVAVGAWAHGTAAATLITLGATLLAVPTLYFTVGLLVSFLAHGTWPEVPSGLPVWLPLAYTRARFDGLFVLLLIVLPCGVTALLLWLFYETTLAELASESDDRTTGRKRWYLVTLPFVTIVAAVPGAMTRSTASTTAWIAGLGGVFAFVVFAAFVFAGDALAPSRRVEFRWMQEGAGWFARMLGPGLIQTATFVLATGLTSMAIFAIAGAASQARGTLRGLPPPPAVELLACAEYWSAFLVFVVGFLAWSRVRADSASGARLLTAMVAVVSIAAPWALFVALGPTVGKRMYDSLVLAAPSPLYTFVMLRAIDRGEPHVPLTSGLVCSLGWICTGLALFAGSARRAAKLVADRRAFSSGLDARIAHETREDAPPAGGVASMGS